MVNKARYTAPASRIFGQGQLCEKRSQFKNGIDQPTWQGVVACPRLKSLGRTVKWRDGNINMVG